MRNASVLASKFNATFDEVWNYAAIVQPYTPPKCITLCVTINVPKVDQPREGKYAIHIQTSINSHGAFYYERHEHGNSKQNYDFDTTSGFKIAKQPQSWIHLETFRITSPQKLWPPKLKNMDV